MGPEIGKWYAERRPAGMKPEDPQIMKALDLFKAGFGQEEAERVKTHRRSGRSRSRRPGRSGQSDSRRPSWACGSSRTTSGTSRSAAVQRPARPDPVCSVATNLVLQELAQVRAREFANRRAAPGGYRRESRVRWTALNVSGSAQNPRYLDDPGPPWYTLPRKRCVALRPRSFPEAGAGPGAP